MAAAAPAIKATFVQEEKERDPWTLSQMSPEQIAPKGTVTSIRSHGHFNFTGAWERGAMQLL